MKKKEIVLILKQKADAEQPTSDFSDFSSRLTQRTESSQNRIKLIEMPDSPKRIRFPAAPLAIAGSVAVVCGIIGFGAIKDSSQIPVYESGIVVTAEPADKPASASDTSAGSGAAEQLRNTSKWKKSSLKDEDISEQDQYNYFTTSETGYCSEALKTIDYTVSYALCGGESAELTLEKKVGDEWLITPYADGCSISISDRAPQNIYGTLTLGVTANNNSSVIFPDKGVYRLVLSVDGETYASDFVIRESYIENPLSWYVSDYEESQTDELPGFNINIDNAKLSAGTITADFTYNSAAADRTVNITSGSDFTLEKYRGGEWYKVTDASFAEDGTFQLVSGGRLSEAKRTFDFGSLNLSSGLYRIVKTFDVYEEYTDTGVYDSRRITKTADFMLTDNDGSCEMFSVENLPYSDYFRLSGAVYGSDVSLITADGGEIADKNYIDRIISAFEYVQLIRCDSFEDRGFAERPIAFTANNGSSYSVSLYVGESNEYFVKTEGQYFYIPSSSRLTELLSYIERGKGYTAPVIDEIPEEKILDMDGIEKGEFNVPDCLTAGQAEMLIKAYSLAEISTGLAEVDFDLDSEPYVPANSVYTYYKVEMPEFDSYEDLNEYAHSIMTDEVLNSINFSESFADVNNEIYYAYGFARNSIPCSYSFIEPVSDNVFRITDVYVTDTSENQPLGDYYVTFSPVGDDEWIITEFQPWN